MGKIDRSELLEYFLAEAEDYLNVLSRGIPELSCYNRQEYPSGRAFQGGAYTQGRCFYRKADCHQPNCPFDGGHPRNFQEWAA